MINGLTVLILTQFILQFIPVQIPMEQRAQNFVPKYFGAPCCSARRRAGDNWGIFDFDSGFPCAFVLLCGSYTKAQRLLCDDETRRLLGMRDHSSSRRVLLDLLYSSSVYVFGSRAGEPPAPGRHLSSAASVGMLEGGLQTRLLLRGEWWYAL